MIVCVSSPSALKRMMPPPPHVFLDGLTVTDHYFKPVLVERIEYNQGSCTHQEDAPMQERLGIPNQTLMIIRNQ